MKKTCYILSVEEAEGALQNALDSRTLHLLRDETDMNFYAAKNEEGDVDLDGDQLDERFAQILKAHRTKHFLGEDGDVLVVENYKQEENKGYKIIEAETYQHEGRLQRRIMLGRKQHSDGGVEYVTWEGWYDPQDDTFTYNFGHYSMDEGKAYADYHKRLAEKYEAYGRYGF